jgi:hypothetical protein
VDPDDDTMAVFMDFEDQEASGGRIDHWAHVDGIAEELAKSLSDVVPSEPAYYLPADFENRFREIARGVVSGQLDERLRLATMLMRQVLMAFPVGPVDPEAPGPLAVRASHDVDERCALCESDTEPFDTASSRFHFGPRRRRP